MKDQSRSILQSDSDVFLDGSLPPLMVRASAGTGKTYRLTARFLQILFQGTAPETILATTFTRKAAGEILDRVLLTLAKAADESDPSSLQKLREQTGIKRLSRTACLQLLSKLIANIHRIRICTLDSLFTQLAKSFPFELQLPPTWRLTDEIEETWLREQAVGSVVENLEPTELATLLSMLSKGDTKRSVVRELVQIVAGTYSLSRLCEPEVWDQVDVPTAPDGAALTEAAGQFFQCQPPQKTVKKKLTSFAELLESRQIDQLSDDTLLRNYATAKRTGIEVKYGSSKLPDGLDDALGTTYAAARSSTLALLAAQNRATGQILSLYDAEMTQQKNLRRALGFEDIAVRLAKQFAHADPRLIDRRMDGAIDHLLLDEFQDTSPAQWQVLRPFAQRVTDERRRQPETSESQTSTSFFCVGDTKQAIYGWRGGVAEIFETVDSEIAGTQSVQQNTSYRSSPVIMETVNRVFKNLKNHPIADADPKGKSPERSQFESRAIHNFCEHFPNHTADQKELTGYVRLETCPSIKDKSADKAQAVFGVVAERITQLNQAAPQRSIGVLTRTNKAVAELIFLLEGRGVDVSQEGGNPLVDSAAVDLVLSALMSAEHPGDGRWRFHVEHSPLSQSSDFSADSIRTMVTDLGISQTVFRLASAIAPACDQRDRTRLQQLTQLAVAYEPNATDRLRDFVRLVREKRVERPQAASVRVMTVHQAKGLEFDAVFLPELDARLVGSPPLCVAEVPNHSEPPVALSRYLATGSWHFLDSQWQEAFGCDAASKMTESLCLLYVAMTRARQGLYMVIQPTKSEEKKASALIQAATCPGIDVSSGDSLLYETGDPNWYA